MPASVNQSERTVDYSVEVRKADGTLYYREASIMFPELPPHPKEPECWTVECINAYNRRLDLWTRECKELAEFYRMLHEYHAARCDYCMHHKGEAIEQKYITGEPVPQTIDEIKAEIEKLRR